MLFIVATPIGNLEDISKRALDTLNHVNYIFCENTKHTKKLLDKFNIKDKKLISFHKFNEKKRIKKLEKLIKEEDIAVVSDAGTPLVSDPGINIVKFAFKNQIKISPIPGPSALTSIISVSGINSLERSISFVGFLPSKKNQKIKKLEEHIEKEDVFIFFESPKRIKETILELSKINKEINIVLGREITKKFEEILFFNIKNIPEIKEKGEFVILVETKKKKIKKIKKEINSTSDLAKNLANYLNISKDKAYKFLINLKEKN
jgi:16S rRNA (cytidine1402-2'-O)-methyltransferase